jgi:hypothetical protein
MKSTENRLITLEPGTYLSTGKSQPTHIELKKQTTGLIIDSTEDKSKDAVLFIVLVGNKLINVWSDQKCT